jgi:hypothetical protein
MFITKTRKKEKKHILYGMQLLYIYDAYDPKI